MAMKSDDPKPNVIRRMLNALHRRTEGANNRYWKKVIRKDRSTFMQFLRKDVVEECEQHARADRITVGMAPSFPRMELGYALEIGYADPDDPLVVPFLDRSIAMAEVLNEVGHWEAWAQGDAMSIAEQKGLISRCLVYARWLKSGEFDLQLLREAYKQLRIALQLMVDEPGFEWLDQMEALHLSTLLLLEVLGPEGAGLEPPPKRAKAKELPEAYFCAVEELRKTGAKDEAVWKKFCDAFDELRDPKLKTLTLQLPFFRLEWGILFCRGTKPPTFIPPPKEVLAAIGR